MAAMSPPSTHALAAGRADALGDDLAAVAGTSLDKGAAAIKRRREIWTALHPDVGGTSGPTQKASLHKDRPQNQQAFAADTAKVSGESKRDVNRHLARADALGDDLAAVAGTSLDKGTAAIKRRREIWTALHPETGGTSGSTGRRQDGKFGDGQQQFAADTAKVSGQSKQDINRHLARADALGDDLAAITGTDKSNLIGYKLATESKKASLVSWLSCFTTLVSR
jgi:hypothetical protein